MNVTLHIHLAINIQEPELMNTITAYLPMVVLAMGNGYEHRI
jgi:hypothetical protein